MTGFAPTGAHGEGGAFTALSASTRSSLQAIVGAGSSQPATPGQSRRASEVVESATTVNEVSADTNGDEKFSKYVGVRWSNKKGKWRVRIKANRKDNHIGFFGDEREAAVAYDKAARRFFPDCERDPDMRLNFADAECTIPAKPSPSPQASGIQAILEATVSASSAGGSPVLPLPPRLTASRPGGCLSTAAPYRSSSEGSMSPGTGPKLAPLVVINDKAAPRGASSSSCRTPSPLCTPSNPHRTNSTNGLSSTSSAISTPGPLRSPLSVPWSPMDGHRGCTSVQQPAINTPALPSITMALGSAMPSTKQGYSGVGTVAGTPSKSGVDIGGELEALIGLVALKGHYGGASGSSSTPRSKRSSVDDVTHDATARRQRRKKSDSPMPPRPASADAVGRHAAKAGSPAGGAGGGRTKPANRGVTWDKSKKMWRVRLCLPGGGREHIGYFEDEESGARAYVKAQERVTAMAEDASSRKQASSGGS